MIETFSTSHYKRCRDHSRHPQNGVSSGKENNLLGTTSGKTLGHKIRSDHIRHTCKIENAGSDSVRNNVVLPRVEGILHHDDKSFHVMKTTRP